jgi:amidohydrolase
MADVPRRIAERVAQARAEVEQVARAIHAHPELAFGEVEAAARLAELFARHDFVVARGVGGLPTAFTATRGSGPRIVAVCLEYDALPGIGHGCGHNLIAGAGALTALALADVAPELGLTVRAIGCPAEERGGGKVPLLDAGVFDDCELAVMVHPVPGDIRRSSGTSSQAVDANHLPRRVAHAAAAPHLGVNAADAVVIACGRAVALAGARHHRISANVVRW